MNRSQRIRLRLTTVVAAISCVLVSCKKDKTAASASGANSDHDQPSTRTDNPDNAGRNEQGEGQKPEQGGKSTGLHPKRSIELLDHPRERRLHPDRAIASSFLWNNWNRFQENYHPLYLIDDDPKTAWVEGAEGSGSGEWIRVYVTPVAETSQVRLRLRNGYHKSKPLHRKNAKAKQLRVILVPSQATTTIVLKDNMKWQEIRLEQPSGKLTAIELHVDSVYPGTKYADLCLSDLEVFATSRAPENPAFEKRKFEEVVAWKTERLAAAKLFNSTQANQLPIAAGYQVHRTSKNKTPLHSGGVPLTDSNALLEYALSNSSEFAKSRALAKAAISFASKFTGWKPVEVKVKNPHKLPAMDGLYRPTAYELAFGQEPNADSYAIPAPGSLEFLNSSQLASFESSSKITIEKALKGESRLCKREDQRHWFFFRPTGELKDNDGVIHQLLVIECGQEEEREGYYTYAGPQLLVYGDNGQLAAHISMRSVTTFSWSTGSPAKIIGGRRLRATYRDIESDQLTVRTE